MRQRDRGCLVQLESCSIETKFKLLSEPSNSLDICMLHYLQSHQKCQRDRTSALFQNRTGISRLKTFFLIASARTCRSAEMRSFNLVADKYERLRRIRMVVRPSRPFLACKVAKSGYLSKYFVVPSPLHSRN